MSYNSSRSTTSPRLHYDHDVSKVILVASSFLAALPLIISKPPYLVREAGRVASIILILRWKTLFAFIIALISWQTIALALLVICLAWRYNRLESPNVNQAKPFLQPLLFPCRTTHTRLFPTKHSFSYSYLLVGIPVGWKGQAGFLSATERTWLSVNTEDYLQRGSHPDGLSGKLRDYLNTQDVDPETLPFAYLVTAPRFLGFSFNPVSFWYLYDNQKSLRAMILEVNNTFDERRMYFLQAGEDTAHFKQKWQKDFHVSPFNDRGGDYSLSTEDILSNLRVDNNIVLSAQDGKPKLVARIFSTEKAINPATISTWQAFRFMLNWAWVGFLTNPRILREARILWVKRLQVFYRPEPFRSSIGRNESPEEEEIEGHFKRWLQSISELQTLRIRYKSAAGKDRGKTHVLGHPNSSLTLTVEVLTPVFYSELATTVNLPATLKRLFSGTSDFDKMAWSDNAEKLVDLAISGQSQKGPVRWYEVLLRIVRSTSKTVTPTAFNYGRSDFDEVARRNGTLNQYFDYLRSAYLVCIANRIALGSTWLLKLYWKIFLWLLLYIGASSILALIERE